MVNLESRVADVHLPWVLPAVHRRAGLAALPRRARPLPLVPRLLLRRRPSGTTCRSRSGSRSCSRTPRRTGSSRSTPGRPGPPSRSCRSTRGSESSTPTRELGHLRADVEALLVAADRTASTLTSAATWSRSTPATSSSAGCAPCGAASTAGRRRAPRSTSSSPMVAQRSRPAPPARRSGGDAVSTYEFSVVDIFAEPYAAAPQLTARLRITGHRAVRRSTRSRCGARSGSSPSGAATTRPTRAACVGCSVTGTAGSTP